MEKLEHLYAELFEAAGAGRRQGEVMAAAADQTQARWQVLWVAGSGLLTAPQIARRLGVSRQSVQRIVGELQASDLVALVENPDHKTSPLVRLSESGRQALDTINAIADDTHQRMLEHFPESDVDELRRLLQKFLATLRAVEPD